MLTEVQDYFKKLDLVANDSFNLQSNDETNVALCFTKLLTFLSLSNRCLKRRENYRKTSLILCFCLFVVVKGRECLHKLLEQS